MVPWGFLRGWSGFCGVLMLERVVCEREGIEGRQGKAKCAG